MCAVVKLFRFSRTECAICWTVRAVSVFFLLHLNHPAPCPSSLLLVLHTHLMAVFKDTGGARRGDSRTKGTEGGSPCTRDAAKLSQPFDVMTEEGATHEPHPDISSALMTELEYWEWKGLNPRLYQADKREKPKNRARSRCRDRRRVVRSMRRGHLPDLLCPALHRRRGGTCRCLPSQPRGAPPLRRDYG